MIYLLDTHVCIRYLNGRSPAIGKRLELASSGEVVLSAVVKAELLYGAAKSANPEPTLSRLMNFFSAFESYPFDDRVAGHYGPIRSQLEKLGTPIRPNDLLIASIALARDATLVTANMREFARVKNLRWEDWEASS